MIFHRVVAREDDLIPDLPDEASFDRMLGWISSWFNVLPLDRAASMLACDRLPERAAAITFDDGYADNHDVALPLLRHHRLCATFFIATGFIDGGRMWNDSVIEAMRAFRGPVLDLTSLGLGAHPAVSLGERRVAIASLIARLKYLPPAERLVHCRAIADIVGASLPVNLMMTSGQVVALRDAGMQIGAHTVNHPILASIPDDEARVEMAASRATLESLLSEPITLFAYPNGKPAVDYLPQHVSLARDAGFTAAVSTRAGVTTRASDPLEMPRFTPWERGRLRFGARLAMNARHPVASGAGRAA